MYSSRRPTLSRRGVVMASAASAMMGRVSLARNATQGTPSVEPNGDRSPSHLLVGISGGLFDDLMYPEVTSFDASFNEVGTLRVNDGVMTVHPTGDPDLMVITTMSDAGLFDIEANELVAIDWGNVDWEMFLAQWSLGILSTSYGEVRSSEWLISATFDASAVLAVNLKTREGYDITEFVNQNNQELVAVRPTYMPEGSLAGLWTGDNVYLIDLERPEGARRLVGDDTELYSTTFDIDPTGTWCSYTTYDPSTEDGEGHVYIENVMSGEYIPVTDGTAWSQVTFIPADPSSFLLIANGSVELRSVDEPQAAGNELAEVHQETHFKSLWDASGARHLLGTRADRDAPVEWIIVDTAGEESTALPELQGLEPLMVTAAQPAPAYLLFGLNGNEPGPVVSLDLETGEVTAYLEGAILGSPATYSSSADGRWYFLSTVNRGNVRGAWLVDNLERQVHEMPWGDGLYTLAGAIAPDGSVAAITTVERPSDAVMTHSVDLRNPTVLEPLAPGHVLGWS
ncbi:MAG TPA: hypothetical protein VKZ61_10590 [Thermomicrobiales bacterium]|nr:hypothetical protein [Thermomicrobiales bacterium]